MLTGNPTLFVVVVLASLLTVGLNLVGVSLPVSVAFADDKDCEKNKGDNNCNDTKKKASPELECKDEIKDNKDSTIDSQCTNNSQILIDSNIISNDGDDGGDNSDGHPNIVFTPTSGPFASTVTIFGTGFDPNSEVTITLADTVMGTSPTDNNGDFDADFVVSTTLLGKQTITASDGSNSDSATFTVTNAGGPTVVLEPVTGPVGTSVSVIGVNFIPGLPVTIGFSGLNPVPTDPSPVIPDSNGVITATFTVPASSTGAMSVFFIQENTLVAAATFTVEASQQSITNTPTGSPSTSGSSTAIQGMLPF